MSAGEYDWRNSVLAAARLWINLESFVLKLQMRWQTCFRSIQILGHRISYGFVQFRWKGAGDASRTRSRVDDGLTRTQNSQWISDHELESSGFGLCGSDNKL